MTIADVAGMDFTLPFPRRSRILRSRKVKIRLSCKFKIATVELGVYLTIVLSIVVGVNDR